MRKFLVLLGLASLLLAAACNQRSFLDGRVVDNFGEPVVGADVRVRGTSFHARTNRDGRFLLRYDPGPLDVVIEKRGYAIKVRELDLFRPMRSPLEPIQAWRMPEGEGLFLQVGNEYLKPACSVARPTRPRSNQWSFRAEGETMRLQTGTARALYVSPAPAGVEDYSALTATYPPIQLQLARHSGGGGAITLSHANSLLAPAPNSAARRQLEYINDRLAVSAPLDGDLGAWMAVTIPNNTANTADLSAWNAECAAFELAPAPSAAHIAEADQLRTQLAGLAASGFRLHDQRPTSMMYAPWSGSVRLFGDTYRILRPSGRYLRFEGLNNQTSVTLLNGWSGRDIFSCGIQALTADSTFVACGDSAGDRTYAAFPNRMSSYWQNGIQNSTGGGPLLQLPHPCVGQSINNPASWPSEMAEMSYCWRRLRDTDFAFTLLSAGSGLDAGSTFPRLLWLGSNSSRPRFGVPSRVGMAAGIADEQTQALLRRLVSAPGTRVSSNGAAWTHHIDPNSLRVTAAEVVNQWADLRFEVTATSVLRPYCNSLQSRFGTASTNPLQPDHCAAPPRRLNLKWRFNAPRNVN